MTALALLATLACAARAQASEASLAYAQGRVTVTADGKARAAKAGDPVSDGATVSTARGATAIVELPDGSKLKLRASSSLRLQLSPGPTGLTGAFLSLGSVFAQVAHGKRPHFAVSTPHAVAAVRGTQFFTAYGRAEKGGRDLWVCVGQGAVEVQADASPEPMTIHEGEGVLLPGGSKTTAPQRYQWTKALNWNMDAGQGAVSDTTKLDAAYSDLKNQDYR